MITIYTDGACRGNQKAENIGAWAYRLECFEEGRSKEDCGTELNTTNNKMELLAVINALKALKEPAKLHQIEVYSDSQYVVSGITEWCSGWMNKGWHNVKNADLWQEFIGLAKQFPKIKFIKVSGHSGDINNERVDALCNIAMNNLKK